MLKKKPVKQRQADRRSKRKQKKAQKKARQKLAMAAATTRTSGDAVAIEMTSMPMKANPMHRDAVSAGGLKVMPPSAGGAASSDGDALPAGWEQRQHEGTMFLKKAQFESSNPTRSLERERCGESDGPGAKSLVEQTEADREKRRMMKEQIRSTPRSIARLSAQDAKRQSLTF